MADDHTRDELAQVRAALAAQEAHFTSQIAALQAGRRRPRHRLPRRFLPLALVALLVMLTPLATFAAGPFNDLTAGVHDANIGLIYDAGITRGCVPNVSYCPTANVTREEMASFLARTAGLGANPPVVNAKTAQTAQTAQSAITAGHAASADTATTATAATNAGHASSADTVGGFAATGLVRTVGKAQTVPLTATGTTEVSIVSVTLTAPGPGYVVVNGAVVVALTATSAGSAFMRVWLRDATNGAESPTMLTDAATAGIYATFSPTFVFPVTAAGTRTYHLMYRAGSGGVTLTADNGMLTALYVPFGPTGTTP